MQAKYRVDHCIVSVHGRAMKRKKATQKPPVTAFRMVGDEKSRDAEKLTRWELVADGQVVATIQLHWASMIYTIQSGSRRMDVDHEDFLGFAAIAAEAKILACVV